MTDEQIIKALKICFEDEECTGCPLENNENECEKFNVWEQAFDLINRQKAEIERLKTENKDISEQFRILDVECERLEKANENQKAEIERHREHIELLDIEHEAIRNKAIKEFAEELISRFSTEIYGWYGEIVLIDDIDNLVKEMVGEG